MTNESVKELLDWLCADKEEVVKKKALNDDVIECYLLDDIPHQLQAIQYLKNRNLRNYLDCLHKFFLQENLHPMVLKEMLSICMEQQIMEEFQLIRNGLEMHFIPHYLEMPSDQDGVQEALSYLSKWFLTKEPNFYQMCKEALFQEAYVQLPLMWEQGDGYLVALSISRYVYQAWNRMAEFNDLLLREDAKDVKLLDLMIETIEFE